MMRGVSENATAGVPILRSIRWTLVYVLVSRAAVLLTVPIVLGQLGEPVYAAWVVAGSLVYSQGLFDMGAGAVAQRYVAAAASDRSRAGVLAVLRAISWFYFWLSVVVSGAVFLLAPTLAGLIDAGDHDGVAVLRYAALAFAATNVVYVLASVLEGCGRVDTSYRLQTVGALMIVPVLLLGLEAGAGVHAIGLTWLAGPVVVTLLLARGCWSLLRELEPGHESDFSMRDLLRLGGGWQVSAWADFASFQLPRVVAGLALPVADLITLDLALRIAQLVVFPLISAFPVVLPLMVRTEKTLGRPALRRLVYELQRAVVAAALVSAALCVPLAPPLVEVWTGRPAESFNQLVTLLIVLGVTLHTTTGIVSSTLLALGTVRTVVVYKTGQLVLSLVLVGPACVVGLVPAAAALALGLIAPAVWFVWKGLRRVGAPPPWVRGRAALQLALVATGCAVVTELASHLTAPASPIVTLLATLLAAGAALVAAAFALGMLPATVRQRTRDALAVPAATPPVY